MQRYIGRVASVPGREGFAFIDIDGVTKSDGSPHELGTNEDIFIHQDECASTITVGLVVEFGIASDHRRGTGHYRATGATEVVSMDVLPREGEAIPGFTAVLLNAGNSSATVLARRHSAHMKMKPVPQPTVQQVRENRPMADIPRNEDVTPTSEQARQLLRLLLLNLFPTLDMFNADFDPVTAQDAELETAVKAASAEYTALDMEHMIPPLLEEIDRFRSLRSTLRFVWETDLVRPQTIIPMERLPDLFMATPVWYFYTQPGEASLIVRSWDTPDPQVPNEVKYFCELFKHERWYDTFQLFNRRVRPLTMYNGEHIPATVMRRMREAYPHFDHIVIATPYHDQAGKEWSDPQWLRAIDPYVLGFKKGLPYFVVLARYSGTGTFPLFEELVGDTIEFLKINRTKIRGFNSVSSPYWYPGTINGAAGDRLMRHIDMMLEAFAAGHLFDWLRGQ